VVDNYLISIYLIIFLITFVQSIAGVGVLVIGTPVMLIFNFKIIEIMYFLLPLSMLTSLINLYFVNFIFKEKIIFEKKIIKHFFLITFIGLIFGLLILKNYSKLINLNIVVSCIIFISIFVKINYSQDKIINLNIRKFFLFIIGIVHGLTNSGGTLLTLLMFNNKEGARGTIHFFYFFLAFAQLLILQLITKNNKALDINWYIVIILVLTSTILGNYFFKKFKNKVNYLVYFLALFSSVVLILKSFV
jgi:hypothetical protein